MIPTKDILECVEITEQSIELMAAVEDFHEHCDNCDDCHQHTTALCPEGDRLLKRASDLRGDGGLSSQAA